LERIILQCLEKSMAARFTTAQALMDELSKLRA
jgi:hypothetical protein